MLFQGTDGLHQRAFKVICNTHNLSGCLHLGGQRPFCRNKLIKGQTGQLHHTVVQCGFKACVGLSGNCVFDFIQCVAQGNLGRHLGDRITCSLACQRGRTADTGVDLDHAVFKAHRMQGKLDVAAACDLQLINNIQGGASEHLVFLVAQGLGRGDNDTVAGMHAYRIDVFHVADSDAVSGAVTHYLVFDFLPAGNAAFH